MLINLNTDQREETLLNHITLSTKL